MQFISIFYYTLPAAQKTLLSFELHTGLLQSLSVRFHQESSFSSVVPVQMLKRQPKKE